MSGAVHKKAVEMPKLTEYKMPSTMSVNAADHADMKKYKPGDKVQMTVHGKVRSSRISDSGSHEMSLDIHKIKC